MNRRRLVFHPKNLPLHKMFAMLSSMGFCWTRQQKTSCFTIAFPCCNMEHKLS
jgi:hypothetical protein